MTLALGALRLGNVALHPAVATPRVVATAVEHPAASPTKRHE